jgi:alkylation response protein AidB-like acyl-CoA dehydrogenase
VNFRLGESSDAFRAEVRAFLREHLPPETLERVHHSGTVHDWAFHRALGARGWIGAAWPKELGGQGRDPFEMAAFFEEAALAAAPLDGLHLTMMVAQTLRHVGTEEQRRSILPGVMAGEILISLGYSEPLAGSDVAAVSTRAERRGDDWVINGQKVFTTMAHEAQYVFLLTRTDPEVPKHRGLTTFLVPLDSPGITIQPIHTLGGERTNATFYGDVVVPDSARVGAIHGGWDVMNVALTFERAGSGGREGERALARFTEWARRAPGSGGARRIDDPPVRAAIARSATQIEVARLLGQRALWIHANGGLPGVEGSMGKLYWSESFQKICAELLDLMGPQGVLQHGEPDAPAAGWIEHAHRHAAVGTIYGGSSEVQREIIAGRGLGLPRSRPR